MGTIYILCASALWGVVHSILASHTVKDALRRAAGPPAFDRLYRFSYNFFALASFFPIAAMLYSYPDRLLYSSPSPWVYLTTIIQGLAVLVLMAAIMQTGPFEFLGLAQLNEVSGSKPPVLMTDGLYAIVRHPLYSGILVFGWLIPEMTVNRLAFIAVLTLYILIGAYFEERKLLKDFGEAYAEYKRKTPMLIPKIVNRKSKMNTRFVRPARNRNETGAIWIQMAAALFGGMILFMGALFTLSLGYSLIFFGRILPGVSVAGVDVSGLSAADAATKLNTALTYPYSGRIVFRDGANVWIETPSQLGLVFDAAASAETAARFGRSLNLFQNLADQLNAVQSGKDLPPVSILDQRMAHQYLQGLGKQIDRPITEASLRINGLDVAAQPGQSGRTLNVDATLVYLSVQMEFFRDGEVPLVIAEHAPEISDASAQAEAARRLLSAPLTLSIPAARPGDPGPWQIQPAELAAMLQVGRVQIGNAPQYVLQLDQPAIQKALDDIAQQVDRRAENARFTFNDETKQLDLMPDKPATVGLTMDVPGSIALVENAVALGQQSAALKVSVNQPDANDTSTAQQLGITENIQTYTSYFRGSGAARLQNIQAAASKFHGLLVAPGETFSMGQYVGDISLDNGFAEALIIYNGQTIKGVGGGVCQVSTTLFRTVFYAGFPIPRDERHAHAYRVYYYEQTATGYDPDLAGLDATVYFPLLDFKFTNDTPYWLLMETYFNPTNYSLTWKLYSTKDGRIVNPETTGPQNRVPALKPVVRENPDLKEGEIKHVDYAAEGADVTVKRTVTTPDGKIIFVDDFFTQYQPWADVCEYGPGTKNLEKQLKKQNLCQQ